MHLEKNISKYLGLDKLPMLAGWWWNLTFYVSDFKSLNETRLWFLIFWLPLFVKIGGCGESSHTYHYATIFSKAPSLVSQSGNTATAKEKYVSQFSQCWAWCNCNSLHKYHLPSKGMMIFLSIHNQAFCKI